MMYGLQYVAMERTCGRCNPKYTWSSRCRQMHLPFERVSFILLQGQHLRVSDVSLPYALYECEAPEASWCTAGAVKGYL